MIPEHLNNSQLQYKELYPNTLGYQFNYCCSCINPHPPQLFYPTTSIWQRGAKDPSLDVSIKEHRESVLYYRDEGLNETNDLVTYFALIWAKGIHDRLTSKDASSLSNPQRKFHFIPEGFFRRWRTNTNEQFAAFAKKDEHTIHFKKSLFSQWFLVDASEDLLFPRFEPMINNRMHEGILCAFETELFKLIDNVSSYKHEEKIPYGLLRAIVALWIVTNTMRGVRTNGSTGMELCRVLAGVRTISNNLAGIELVYSPSGDLAKRFSIPAPPSPTSQIRLDHIHVPYRGGKAILMPISSELTIIPLLGGIFAKHKDTSSPLILKKEASHSQIAGLFYYALNQMIIKDMVFTPVSNFDKVEAEYSKKYEVEKCQCGNSDNCPLLVFPAKKKQIEIRLASRFDIKDSVRNSL